ncbi:MAG: DUF4388 domain-containing protein [Roseiflexaceae bacterium]|nr:DUF4388 domain-containing protein [Roseiflexaceae bacterium]
MLFTGNFALISAASLLQAICQERRSARLSAWRGASAAHIDILEGLIVGAHCDQQNGEEAVYSLVGWESGQFQLEQLDRLPDDLTMAAEWEGLILEAARRRDDREDIGLALPARPTAQYVAALLLDCPALSGLALVGRDGRLLAAAGLPDALLARAAMVAVGLDTIRRSLGEFAPVTQLVNGAQTLLLADWGHELLALGCLAEGQVLELAMRQLIDGAPADDLLSIAFLVEV